MNRIVVVDDHPLILAGINLAMKDQPMCEVVACVNSIEKLLSVLDEQACDVVVMDYSMPKEQFPDGVNLVGLLRRRYPKIRLLVLTMVENPMVISQLASLDIAGLLSKADSFDCLVQAIGTLRSGQRYFSPTIRSILEAGAKRHAVEVENLSPKELEVLGLLVSGLTVTEIAQKLRRSKKTISAHKISVMNKFGIKNDAELFEIAFRYNFGQPVRR